MRLRLKVALIALLAWPSFAQSQNARSDFRAALDDAVGAAAELRNADEWEQTRLKPAVEDWERRLKLHNDKKCTYPEGQPEVCSAYETNRRALEEERTKLRDASSMLDAARRTHRNRIQLAKAKARIAAVTIALACGCGRESESDKSCWDGCFDKTDLRLKSCLDIADLDETRSCLDRNRSTSRDD